MKSILDVDPNNIIPALIINNNCACPKCKTEFHAPEYVSLGDYTIQPVQCRACSHKFALQFIRTSKPGDFIYTYLLCVISTDEAAQAIATKKGGSK